MLWASSVFNRHLKELALRKAIAESTTLQNASLVLLTNYITTQAKVLVVGLAC